MCCCFASSLAKENAKKTGPHSSYRPQVPTEYDHICPICKWKIGSIQKKPGERMKAIGNISRNNIEIYQYTKQRSQHDVQSPRSNMGYKHGNYPETVRKPRRPRQSYTRLNDQSHSYTTKNSPTGKNYWSSGYSDSSSQYYLSSSIERRTPTSERYWNSYDSQENIF